MGNAKEVLVLGAGGHSKVVVRTLEVLNYSVVAVLDDNEQLWGTQLCGVPITGPIASAEEYLGMPSVLAIGDNQTRRKLSSQLSCDWLTVVHPSAVVDTSVVIGEGTVVFAGTVIQADTRIGRHAIVNTGASVDHDVVLGDFAHVAPGVHLAGNVHVGSGAFVGIGSSVIQGMTIGSWSTVGAGASVVRDVAPDSLVVGVPAKPKKAAPASNNPIKSNASTNTFDVGILSDLPETAQAAEAKEKTVDRPARIYLSPPHMSPRERELLLDAFDSNWIAPLGPHVDAFEEEFAAQVGAKHAVALSSGTAALHLSLILAGVERGDEVYTSTLTFAATTNAITYVGAKPVLIDSDQPSWNMDPELLGEALEAAAQRGKLPTAVVAVDLYGQCADYDRIAKLCQFYEVPLIEDAAEALGATYHGKSAGTFGEFGILFLQREQDHHH